MYPAHIEFSLGKRSDVEFAREVFLFIPICGLEEQAETMERRAHGFRHGDLLNIGEEQPAYSTFYFCAIRSGNYFAFSLAYCSSVSMS